MRSAHYSIKVFYCLLPDAIYVFVFRLNHCRLSTLAVDLLVVVVLFVSRCLLFPQLYLHIT